MRFDSEATRTYCTVWWPRRALPVCRAMPLRRSRADFATYARHVATGLRRSRDVFATFARRATPLRLSRDAFATVARHLCDCRKSVARLSVPAHLQCLAFSSIHLPSSSGDGTCNCPIYRGGHDFPGSCTHVEESQSRDLVPSIYCAPCTCLIILHCVPCNNDVYTCYSTVLRLNDANSSRERRKGIARTSQTCRNVSRVCRKVGARPSQRHRANVANLSQRVARMSQSRRATVAKASRDIPAMPFSATILCDIRATRCDRFATFARCLCDVRATTVDMSRRLCDIRATRCDRVATSA